MISESELQEWEKDLKCQTVGCCDCPPPGSAEKRLQIIITELRTCRASLKVATDGLEKIKANSNMTLLGRCCVDRECDRGDCEVQNKAHSAFAQQGEIASECLAEIRSETHSKGEENASGS